MILEFQHLAEIGAGMEGCCQPHHPAGYSRTRNSLSTGGSRHEPDDARERPYITVRAGHSSSAPDQIRIAESPNRPRGGANVECWLKSGGEDAGEMPETHELCVPQLREEDRREHTRWITEIPDLKAFESASHRFVGIRVSTQTPLPLPLKSRTSLGCGASLPLETALAEVFPMVTQTSPNELVCSVRTCVSVT